MMNEWVIERVLTVHSRLSIYCCFLINHNKHISKMFLISATCLCRSMGKQIESLQGFFFLPNNFIENCLFHYIFNFNKIKTQNKNIVGVFNDKTWLGLINKWSQRSAEFLSGNQTQNSLLSRQVY